MSSLWVDNFFYQIWGTLIIIFSNSFSGKFSFQMLYFFFQKCLFIFFNSFHFSVEIPYINIMTIFF